MSNNHPQPFGFKDARDGDIGPDGTPFGVRSPVARQAVDESFVALSRETHDNPNRHVCNDVGPDGNPFGVRSSITCWSPIDNQAIHDSYHTSKGAAVHPSEDKKDNHHSTINYSMVDDGKKILPMHDDGKKIIPTQKFCHTFASKSGVASMRSRAASVAWLHNSSSQLLSRSAIKRRQRRKKKKEVKQSALLQIIGPNDN